MDMERLARRVSEQSASRPSRRGIISVGAKLAVGAGAVLASLRDPSEAAGAQIGDTCCNGPRECSAGICERGTKERWSWTCATDSGAMYRCQDCDRGKRTICVVATPI